MSKKEFLRSVWPLEKKVAVSEKLRYVFSAHNLALIALAYWRARKAGIPLA